MNKIKYIIAIITLLVFASSCKKDIDNLQVLDDVTAPANLTAAFDITNDNSGLVTIFPSAEGVTEYLIYFGDTDNETPESFAVNDEISHVYAEGVYDVKITALGLTGLSADFEQEITVSFRAPENFVVDVEYDDVNPKIINVTADADYATVIDIYFGDQFDEVPETVLPGETVSHTYDDPGDYILTAVARSGGEANAEYTETITIVEASDPINLPIDFESYTINYAFSDFGNAVTTVVDNPETGGLNTSARVARSEKPSGAETWAGTYLTLEDPIDFSENDLFKVKVLSPKVGAVVKLKVENLTNGDIAYEVDAVTTVADEWEELSYDFSGISLTDEYQKVVIFFDFGNPGDDSQYYFDDIKLIPSVVGDLLIEDFEGTPPVFTDFDGGTVTIIDNPYSSGINTSSKVAKMVKDGGQSWGGSYFTLDDPIDFTIRKTFKMKVYSNKVGTKVLLKVENISDPNTYYEVEVTTTLANEWEELTFDYGGIDDTQSYQKLVLIFDLGTVGNGTEDFTYYFDDIILTN